MERKPRLLFVVEAMGGGIFTYIVDLANELANKFDMYIAYGIRKQTPEDYEEYFDKRVHLIKVNSFERSINPMKDVRAFFEVRRIADEIKPDIIHLHSSKAGAIGRAAFDKYKLNGKNVPVFYTPHGYSFLMKNHGPMKRTAYRLIEKACGKLNCTTISCSAGEHQESLKLNKRAVFVDNGINVEKLEQVLKNIEIVEHPFTVFTLGRICYQKNPKMFNEIAQALPEVRFLWIGDGELRNELQSENIEITGWVDRQSALTKAMSADVFILTSLWEGLPISLLEAMYMKKLCVVSDVIGNRDVIQNGINGFVCRNAGDFVFAICTAKDERSKHFVEIAYDNILHHYNTKTMAEEYALIYTGGGVLNS